MCCRTAGKCDGLRMNLSWSTGGHSAGVPVTRTQGIRCRSSPRHLRKVLDAPSDPGSVVSRGWTTVPMVLCLIRRRRVDVIWSTCSIATAHSIGGRLSRQRAPMGRRFRIETHIFHTRCSRHHSGAQRVHSQDADGRYPDVRRQLSWPACCRTKNGYRVASGQMLPRDS